MNYREWWVLKASEYARSVAPNSERYGYVRGPQGGWIWEIVKNESTEYGRTPGRLSNSGAGN